MLLRLLLGLTAAAALDALGIFSFRFAVPALLFRLIARQSLDDSFNWTFYGGYLASGFLIFVLVFGVSLALNRQAVATAGAAAPRLQTRSSRSAAVSA